MTEDIRELKERIKRLEQQLALLEDDLYRQRRQKRMEATGMTLEEILEEEELISEAVNKALDEVESELDEEGEEGRELSEIEIKRLEKDLNNLFD